MNVKEKKTLIAYFSWSGVTREVAQKLAERTGGTLFEIETVKEYPSGRACIDYAKRELEQGPLPAIKSPPPDLAPYDLVLVGGPVWWYTVATPVMSFLLQADFAGRNAAAFCTHEGGVGRYFQHFKEQAQNARVLEGLEMFSPRRAGPAAVNKALDDWLRGLS